MQIGCCLAVLVGPTDRFVSTDNKADSLGLLVALCISMESRLFVLVKCSVADVDLYHFTVDSHL